MKIGVDGGGTKTELILLGDGDVILNRHLAAGCNPNIAGPDHARAILDAALAALLAGRPDPFDHARVERTALYMAGAPAFWRETAADLAESNAFGHVTADDDSLPVLELATNGAPGLVLHGGTGSFVAARAPDGAIHYAGGLGWRLGDPGSGYDLGRRTLSRALLELQGWQLPTRLSTLVRDHSGLTDARAITRYYYQHAEPNKQIAALAPSILRLAAEGDHASHQVVVESCVGLLQLAEMVTIKLFAGWHLDDLPAGVSGPILCHPATRGVLATRSSLSLRPITDAPIEGVRRLLERAR